MHVNINRLHLPIMLVCWLLVTMKREVMVMQMIMKFITLIKY